SLPLCGVFNNTGCNVYWNISGSVYQDLNSNCQYDGGEQPVSPVKVKLYQGNNLVQQGYFQGNYSFDTNLSSYRIEVDTTNFPFYVSCPSHGDTTVTVSAADSLLFNVNMGLTCKPGSDIGIKDIHTGYKGLGSIFFPDNLTVVNINAGDMTKSF